MINKRKLCSAILAASFLPCLSTAQGGAVKGRVTSADKNPLSAARISVAGTAIVTSSDSTGEYRISGIASGHHNLEVRIIGYTPVTLSVDVADGIEIDVPIVMSATAVALDTVNVVADFVSPAMRGFEERRSRGTGRFFTREDLLKMNPRVFTDVLRRVPGMQIQSAGGSMNNSEAVRSGRIEGLVGPRVCNVLFFLNGSPFPLQQDYTINHFVSPADVVGVEVYPGASEIPPQFETGAYNARCGVVVIWTREGAEKKRKR